MSDHLKTLLTYLVDQDSPGLHAASFIHNHQDWWRSLPEAGLIKRVLAQDPEFAYYYAIIEVCGRWPEGEPAIASDPEWAYYYAKYVIKGRWPMGEPAIRRSDFYSSNYDTYLKRKVRESTKMVFFDIGRPDSLTSVNINVKKTLYDYLEEEASACATGAGSIASAPGVGQNERSSGRQVGASKKKVGSLFKATKRKREKHK